MQASTIQMLGLALFVIAIFHTFSVKVFQKWANRFPDGSVGENFFHLLGEVEVVFGIWAGTLLGSMLILEGSATTTAYIESFNFVEPLFVFVILVICSTQPILTLAENLISFFAKMLPFSRPISFLLSALIVGPLLGSLITEPAAMTVTALVLLDYFYKKGISEKLKYAIIGVLFVNVSVGGTLTPFAAPPVIMVAGQWGWDLKHMLLNFGWRGALACAFSAALLAFRYKKEIDTIRVDRTSKQKGIPIWIQGIHLLVLLAVVYFAHHPKIFIGFFLFFLGVVRVTKEYQKPLQLQQGLLVSFFLAGLVILGGVQDWWLRPVLGSMNSLVLFFGSVSLTAVTDNAALTYLGSLVPTLTDASKYSLVAGAVVGGGLTVIANAPNPAGYSILNGSFGKTGISPLELFKAASIPTAIAAACFLV